MLNCDWPKPTYVDQRLKSSINRYHLFLIAEEQIQAEADLKIEERERRREVAAVNLGLAQAQKEKIAEENTHRLPHVS